MAIVVQHLTVARIAEGLVMSWNTANDAVLAEGRKASWRTGLDVVAMDGFTGFKTAATEEPLTAATVMDPLHVVRLGGEALDKCRRRVQLDIYGHQGRKDDPRYRSRRTLRGHQRTPRTPPRISTRIPQPHQRHRQIPARNR